MKLYGVFGAGGYGREVIPQVQDMAALGSTECKAVFVEDAPTAGEINGHPVMSFDDFCNSDVSDKELVLAIGDSKIREKVAKRCESHGIGFFSTFAQNSVVLQNVEMSFGAIISPFVTITSNVKIGSHFHANLYSYVAHDCEIGNYVTLAPNVHCNGNIVIDDHAYIGTGAILRQGSQDAPLRIGRGAVVGMGAVVTKDVPSGVTVVGNPARIMPRKKQT